MSPRQQILLDDTAFAVAFTVGVLSLFAALFGVAYALGGSP